MADNWTDWYSGNMAPPLVMPGGGYAPAPVQAPMSVEDIYRGIYTPSAPSLTSVSRPTVPINPQTGMPYATTANASAKYGAGIGYQAAGSADMRPPAQPNPLPGVRDLGAPQYGTPGSGGGVLTPAGLPGNATIDKRFTERVPSPPYGGYVAAPRFASLPKAPDYRGYTGSMRFASSSNTPTHNLNYEPSAAEGQEIADQMGIAVRTPGRKVYQPKYAGSSVMPSGKIAQRGPRPAGTPPAPPRSGGLLSLFGGGNGGGILSGLFGGNSAPRSQAVAQPTSGPAIYTPSGAVHPGSFHDNSGNDMAFMPQAYQDNPRNSNGGY